MENSKNIEVKEINEAYLLKNKSKFNGQKRKLSDISFIGEYPTDESKINCKFVENEKVNEYEMIKENNTSGYLLCENKNLFETKNDLLEIKDLNEQLYINESCTNQPNKKKRKKRKKKIEIEMIKPTKQMIRINYLLQASFLMNKFNVNISREYIKTMRRLSNKLLIKYDKKFKKLFCKKCNSVLVPSDTCKVSVDPLNLQKKKNNKNEFIKDPLNTNNNFNIESRDEYLVSYKCNYCHNNTKFVYENNLIASPKKGNLRSSTSNVHKP